MIRALIFDLDDTLYREKDFVRSGYRAVAQHVAKAYKCKFERVFSTMMNTLSTHGKEMVLPVLKDRFLDPSIPLTELVGIYRIHRPAICLFPGYLKLLKALGNSYRLGIITDGLPEVQKRKVRALDLENLMDNIVYTWEYGREKEKPHPYPFSLMLTTLQAKADSSLFIGDSLGKDCRGAHEAGMRCVQVGSPSSSGNPSVGAEGKQPDFIIESLHQLPEILQQIN
jgi:putative hydrolase of the HAD superfamily